MASEIEACRALMYQVAADADAGRDGRPSGVDGEVLASEMSERVTSEALQIHGGAGYTTDFPIERYWRDARLTKIFEGTSEIQLRIVSDRYLPRPRAPSDPSGRRAAFQDLPLALRGSASTMRTSFGAFTAPSGPRTCRNRSSVSTTSPPPVR